MKRFRPLRLSVWLLVSIGTSLSLVGPGNPARAALPVEFNRDIRPILSDRCFACHGPDANTREAGLRLDVREAAIEFGALVPGDVEASELVFRIETDDPDLRMPPDEHGKPLSPAERELLTEWIRQGATYQRHWSLVPIRRPDLPQPQTTDEATGGNEVDAFIRSRLHNEQITPSPEADPRTLVRRLAFDLTGLPPTPEMVEDFAANPTPEAYVRLVEQLLDSPHHGERMAMYWLDLVRYADTLGYHGDQVRSVSPYRDYVIATFNENKPFDEFTIEQLAGDLLPDATLEQRVASTYNRLNRASAEGGVQPKEYLAKYAADRVRTTGAVWLGSTFGCAECHDHKFDPFTTKDFYRFAAFFADVKELGIVRGADHVAKLPVPSEEQAAREQQLESEIARLEQELRRETPQRNAAFEEWVSAAEAPLQGWQSLRVLEAKSQGGAKLAVQPDGSVLASGKNPDRDVYTLKIDTDLTSLGGLRLTVLPHNQLPQQGPGRAANGNLVIHAVELLVDGEPVTWKSAAASHTQDQHSPEFVVDGSPNGWAIGSQIGQAQELWLTTESAVELSPESRITLRIEQNHGKKHTVGHFRLQARGETFDPKPLSGWPHDLIERRTTSGGQPAEEDREALWKAFRETTPSLADVRDELDRNRKALAELQASIVTTLATSSTEPRMMRVLPRGNWMDDSGEIVEPGTPHFLPSPKAEAGERLDRLDLALWMTSRENPLVARTFVNRLWMLFFGRGICASVDDLGSQGQWPTHPELLDWLAAEFIDSGWDVRHLIRLMVTSETYRQSSMASPERVARDPYNRWFARQSRWRLDAEMVRDNALAVSGLLVRDIGGVSVMPYQPAGYWAQLNFPKRTYQHDHGAKQYRRGLYTHWQRTFLHPSLLAFDAPAREECTAQRSRSNTPLQSLVLLNDPTYVEAARVLAARVVREGGDSFSSRLEWLFRNSLARLPRDSERPVLRELLESHRNRYEANPDSAAALLQVGEMAAPDDLDAAEVASWTAVTRAILNLHETITRY